MIFKFPSIWFTLDHILSGLDQKRTIFEQTFDQIRTETAFDPSKVRLGQKKPKIGQKPTINSPHLETIKVKEKKPQTAKKKAKKAKKRPKSA